MEGKFIIPYLVEDHSPPFLPVSVLNKYRNLKVLVFMLHSKCLYYTKYKHLVTPFPHLTTSLAAMQRAIVPLCLAFMPEHALKG